jgi:hypothetical protein
VAAAATESGMTREAASSMSTAGMATAMLRPHGYSQEKGEGR